MNVDSAGLDSRWCSALLTGHFPSFAERQRSGHGPRDVDLMDSQHLCATEMEELALGSDIPISFGPLDAKAWTRGVLEHVET